MFFSGYKIDYVHERAYDAGSKKFIIYILNKYPEENIKIAHDWIFEPTFNFYREKYRLNILKFTRQ
jgi:hypothetical protein